MSAATLVQFEEVFTVSVNWYKKNISAIFWFSLMAIVLTESILAALMPRFRRDPRPTNLHKLLVDLGDPGQRVTPERVNRVLPPGFNVVRKDEASTH